VIYKADTLEKALNKGEEALVLQMLQTSNTPAIKPVKVPTEALFIDWEAPK